MRVALQSGLSASVLTTQTLALFPILLPAHYQPVTAPLVVTMPDQAGAMLPGGAESITRRGTNVTRTVQTAPREDYTENGGRFNSNASS